MCSRLLSPDAKPFVEAPGLYLPPFRRGARPLHHRVLLAPTTGAPGEDDGSDSDKASVDTSAAGSSLASTDRDEEACEEVAEWPWDLISPGNWRVRNTFLHSPLNKFTVMQIFQRRRRALSVPAGGREAFEREEATQPPALTPACEDPWATLDLASTTSSSTPRPEVLVVQVEDAGMSTGVGEELALRRISEGSVAHAHGQCKPCAFFWKDVGCKSGIACQFCHVCEPDERKRRNREKRAVTQMRGLGLAAPTVPLFASQSSTFPGEPSTTPSMPEETLSRTDAHLTLVSDLSMPWLDPQASPPEEAAQRLASQSQGSVGHAQGKCKPCAFFGKGVGCNNGVSCNFCHLCGADERKRRSKEKRVAMQEHASKRRSNQSQAQFQECIDVEQDQGARVGLAA